MEERAHSFMLTMSSTNREYDELLTEHFRYTPLVSRPPPRQNRYCLFFLTRLVPY